MEHPIKAASLSDRENQPYACPSDFLDGESLQVKKVQKNGGTNQKMIRRPEDLAPLCLCASICRLRPTAVDS